MPIEINGMSIAEFKKQQIEKGEIYVCKKGDHIERIDGRLYINGELSSAKSLSIGGGVTAATTQIGNKEIIVIT